MCVLTILYGGVLLTFSLSSSEKVLDSDGFKYFCGIDCHVAYSIVDFRTSKTIGPLTNATQADGIFFIVTLQTWFDERTIANHRVKDLALTPDPRIVTLMDAQGNHYLLSERGQRALEEAEGPSSPLNHPLLPGESYTTRLAFDLPAHIQNPRLWIGDAHWATHLLVGHENSFFHKKIFFQL